MLSVQNLTMHFTGEDLFSNISFLIREKDRIGLVGKNGAGKTTLLKLICGLEQPHKGSVVKPVDLTIGYLPQEKPLDSRRSVLDEALTAFENIRVLEQRLHILNDQLLVRSDYESAAYHNIISEISLLNERLRLLGGHSMEGNAEQILIGLGFEHEDMFRFMHEFSNGWQMRVELAKLLLQQPGLLLLDEPTNHLDIESIQWLEKFLQSSNSAVMLVSHDRAFLDNVTKRTIEISSGTVYDYKASYSEYLEMRHLRIESQTAVYENQQREVREIERFIERFRYKATKAKQVQSRIKQLERMDEVVVDDLDTKSIHFRFPPAPHSGKITLEAHGLSKHYGALKVIDQQDLQIVRGDRIAFVGRNGEGKSTLAKILAGVLDYQGELKYGHQVTVGYYAQNQHEMLDMEKTVFEILDEVAVGDVRTRLKAILGAFLFSGDTVDKKVKVLSGGEKARLSLARMLLFPSSLLILDEPTNHLDMQSKDILKSSLLQYDGTLIVVSHDRDFLQGLTNKVFEFRKPIIKEYLGDIYDFLRERDIAGLKELEMAPERAVNREISMSSDNKKRWEEKKVFEKEKRRIEKQIEQIEVDISLNEAQIAAMDEILQDPGKNPGEAPDAVFFDLYQRLKSQHDELMASWEERQHELSQYDDKLTAYQ